MTIDKRTITILLGFGLAISGYLMPQTLLFSAGLFSLCGSLTNEIALYMLFERIPGLYGSGVIPLQHERLKESIRQLMMTQFFDDEKMDTLIERFTSDNPIKGEQLLRQFDLNPVFDQIVLAVKASKFGGMLDMIGGGALESLRESALAHLQLGLAEAIDDKKFGTKLEQMLKQPDAKQHLQRTFTTLIQTQLDQLTAQQVKEIIRAMVHKHLGWLVVWGGIGGGCIGLLAGLIGSGVPY